MHFQEVQLQDVERDHVPLRLDQDDKAMKNCKNRTTYDEFLDEIFRLWVESFWETVIKLLYLLPCKEMR